MKRCIDALVYVVVRLTLSAIQALRIETCAALTRPLAWLICDIIRFREAVIDDNLSHAFPELTAVERRDLTRRHWEHILLMIFEMAQADRKIHELNWRQHIRLRNMERMVDTLLERNPCVVVAGHFGNFEISARMLGLFGFKTFVVARPLDNPWVDQFLNQFRARFGQRILPKKGSAADADALLTAGGILAVLADQAAGPKGCWVDFFGRPASTHKAIALMSLAHQAPLMVTYARRTGAPMRFEIGMDAMVDPREEGAETAGVRELTAWYTKRLETIIRRDPEQYWWVHRRWKDQREVRTAKRRAA